MVQDPPADQYALEQILNQYANKYQKVSRLSEEEVQDYANDLSRAKLEPQLHDSMSKMSRTKLQEAAQSNQQTHSAMHSTEQYRPQDTTSLDNWPVLTPAGQFDFPAHLFASNETSA